MAFKFSPDVARRILDQIRRGNTLLFVCENQLEGPETPDLLTIYDWLKDPTLMLEDGVSFSAAYNQAKADQALTWQDQAAAVYDELKNSKRRDNYILNEANKRASLLLTMSKEARLALAEQRKQTQELAGGVELRIRTFYNAEEADKEPLDPNFQAIEPNQEFVEIEGPDAELYEEPAEDK